MTISLGITTLRDSDDEKTLFTRADEALYQAKQDGRNCIRITGSGN
jgi:diguanylate cyclase